MRPIRLARRVLRETLLVAALLSITSCASSSRDVERADPATITITLPVEDGSAEQVATKLNAIFEELRRGNEVDVVDRTSVRDLSAVARRTRRVEANDPYSVVFCVESLEGTELEALLDLFAQISGESTRETSMDFDVAAALPTLTPKAVAWAELRSAEIQASGRALDADELAIARSVEVANPERIRIALVDRIPLPDDPELRAAAVQTGLLGEDVVGLTLGHGIYVRRGSLDRRVLAHECRHVAQYERAGSIAAFLPEYLRQIATHGYEDAPYEVDARAHELPR